MGGINGGVTSLLGPAQLSVTEHRIPHPGPTLSVRVRAVSVDGDKVSAWSPASSLGEPRP